MICHTPYYITILYKFPMEISLDAVNPRRMPGEIGTGIWVDKQSEKADFRLENDPQNSPH